MTYMICTGQMIPICELNMSILLPSKIWGFIVTEILESLQKKELSLTKKKAINKIMNLTQCLSLVILKANII